MLLLPGTGGAGAAKEKKNTCKGKTREIVLWLFVSFCRNSTFLSPFSYSRLLLCCFCRCRCVSFRRSVVLSLCNIRKLKFVLSRSNTFPSLAFCVSQIFLFSFFSRYWTITRCGPQLYAVPVMHATGPDLLAPAQLLPHVRMLQWVALLTVLQCWLTRQSTIYIHSEAIRLS